MHGCTLSCLSVSGNRFQCSWVGDSSVLLYRRSSTSWITSNHDVLLKRTQGLSPAQSVLAIGQRRGAVGFQKGMFVAF